MPFFLLLQLQQLKLRLLCFSRGEATPGGRRLIEDMPLSLQMDVTYEETKDYLEKVFFFIYVFVNLSMFLFHSEQKNKYTLSELINGFLK